MLFYMSNSLQINIFLHIYIGTFIFLYSSRMKQKLSYIKVVKIGVVRLCFVTRVTRRMPLVEQKVLTLPKHGVQSMFLWGSCCQTLITVCILVHFLFATILSVCLRSTASEYTCGIFKPFLVICSTIAIFTFCF